MRFSKLHGLGNDYVFLDTWRDPVPSDPARLAQQISDRRQGVGSDGLILIGPAQDPANHARMQMWNADGSASEMCGNGLRCAAKLAFDHGHLPHVADLRFETGAGVLTVHLLHSAGACTGARVSMGPPRLTPASIPVIGRVKDGRIDLVLTPTGTTSYPLIAVGMGNPHAVCFVDDVASVPLHDIGPRLEHDPVFPHRANIEFVQVLAPEDGHAVLRQRTWERGSGETAACGTGACASLVAALLSGRLVDRRATVRLDGGDLQISWPDPKAAVLMSGPATHVFDGDWPEA